ncbi:endonuclease NucS domain-containing protein [Nostoc sp.]|uniref:endonuclease NucS domain-containing protein n=1 Tax=Nostoc sp. TaxID=1180 RepID=UPI002FF8F5D0
MVAGAALRKTGTGWEFASEAALEDFVWDNLQQLSGLIPLKRQYAVKGEICDILALNETRQLVILELKNTEDRYIVQQLTRYYDNLLEDKPFPEQIDYSESVKLIAIAPSFHRHNLIDRKYNQLNIELLQCTVIRNNQDFILQLIDIGSNNRYSIPISYQELEISKSSDIPAPPQILLDWLGNCTGEEQQAILKLREKVLDFDERIKEEMEGKNVIMYGRSKTKPVAEIYYQRSKSKPIIFLWLPTPTSWRKEVIGRIRLWLDGSVVTHVGHVPEGFGKMKLQSEWDAMPREKRPGNYYHNKYLAFQSGIYNKFLQQDFQSTVFLESLVDLALSKWLTRI